MQPAWTHGFPRRLLLPAEHPQRSFRLVCPPRQKEAVLALLKAQGFDFEPEPFCHWAYTATNSPIPLGSSLAAWFGCIYIQDRASMLGPLALVQDAPPPLMLDMCASPGGKSSFLATLAGNTSLVLANEPNKERFQTLRRNLNRLQLPNAAHCQYPGEQLPMQDASVPAILLDPPCSGWGTTDKHPRVTSLWQGEKVAPLVALQQHLLREAARMLAPGGRLLYATCTTNVAENEEQVLLAQEELGLELQQLPPFAGFHFLPPQHDGCQGCLRIDQERSQAQGHFLALLRKPGASGDLPRHGLPGEPLPPDVQDTALIEQAAPLLGPGQARLFRDNVHFLHDSAALLPPALRWRGPQLGRLARDRFRPLPRARLLLPETPGPGDFVAEDPQQLTRLLAGQSLEAPDDAGSDGLCGLYFRELGLGWLKRKGRRLLWAER